KYLALARNIEVWLPPGYDETPERRYQVLYMQDGQNLFDPRIAYTNTDWGVDEAITRLVDAGKIEPVIVVATWYTVARFDEYDPWGKGPQYAKFLMEEVMPMVNTKYRTLTGPENTGVMGGSMGGLISFYLGLKHPDVFGKVGCMSTYFIWNGDVKNPGDRPPLIEKILCDPTIHFPKTVKAYFDYGTGGEDAAFEPLQLKVNEWLKKDGLMEGRDFISRKFEGADHSNKAWRARLDTPLEFLFAK
ncbi:MAG: alpha/beta hydrolase-fold protein, partial [Candidatus Sumerlaeota bacterium]